MLSLQKDNLHHAYILEGDKVTLLAELHTFVEQGLGMALRGNPDFYERETDTFGIDEARALRERASMRPTANGKKIFILSVRTITDQAQNALLKLFEEPTPDTHFFLIIQSALELLLTLRSRMILLGSDGQGQVVSAKVKTFIKASPAKRLDIVGDVLKELHKDEEKGLVKGRALQFLSELEIELCKTLTMEKLTADEQLFFSQLVQAREFITDQGSSAKMLLEHVTLMLPRY
jgi:hypothetical protein